MRHPKPNHLAPVPVGAERIRTVSAQLKTAPTKIEIGQRSWKQRQLYTRGESVYLFLEFTMVNVSGILFPYQDFLTYEVSCFKVLAVSNELIHSCSAV